MDWEDGERFGADILGFGSYYFISGGSGKSKGKALIGFVRPKNEPANVGRASTKKDVHGKSGLPVKRRGQKSKARGK